MKLKRIFFLLLPVAGLLITSCTKLDAPYVSIRHGSIVDTIINWDTVNPVKKVLLEDYTGHKCVNCPEAAIIAENLKGLYGGKLIILAVHAGFYATPGASGDFTADYTTPAGNEWNTEFGITSNPNGLVNRKDFGSGRVLAKEVWGTSVSQLISQDPDAFIVIKNEYDTSTRKLNTVVYTKFINALPGTYRLSLVVAEDSLRSPQKNNNPDIGPTPTWYDYLFMNVMRGGLNGTWGDVLTTAVNPVYTYMGKFFYNLKPAWNASNCWLYAIVFREDTKEIIQVDRKKVMQ
jgi:hypothetical protein